MTHLTPDEMRFLVAAAAGDGDPLDAIERELIDPSPLSDEAKSSLWLYAWSSAALGRGRRIVPDRDSLLV